MSFMGRTLERKRLRSTRELNGSAAAEAAISDIVLSLARNRRRRKPPGSSHVTLRQASRPRPRALAEAGWVNADGEAAIRRDVAGHSSKLDLASALGILGAVLIGFGAMSFVAAHWSEMPKLSASP